jgi:hypothetical protein
LFCSTGTQTTMNSLAILVRFLIGSACKKSGILMSTVLSSSLIATKLIDSRKERPQSCYTRDLERLYLWKINQSASNFKLERVVSIPLFATCIGTVNGQIAYAALGSFDPPSNTINAYNYSYIALCDKAGSVTLLNNSRFHFGRHFSRSFPSCNTAVSFRLICSITRKF